MNGMNANTGKALAGIDHIRQSVKDILTTPIGSRVMRRNYGSEVMELIDQPDNGITRVRLYAATFTALMQWEPRIKVSRIVLNTEGTPEQGACTLDIYGRISSSEEVSMRIPIGGRV